MNRALYAAATGMAAQQANLDVIADNLANADVTAFKRATATFAPLGDGLGTVPTGVVRSFVQGKLERSGGPFDVAIEGRGFFRLEKNGERAYTRAGSFGRAADGALRTADGWRLVDLRIPAEVVAVSVGPDGRVTGKTNAGSARALGRIRLACFDAPERLRPLGAATFAYSPDAGRLGLVEPGAPHGPVLAFGMLERSNVSIVEAMMAILTAQRAYEANAKGVQAADEMQRIANNLHRG